MYRTVVCNRRLHIWRKERAVRLIDADALKEWIDEYVSVFKKSDNKDIKGYIEHQPTIEPKRGEWIDMGDFEQCSVCKGTRLKEFQSYYGKTTWIKTPYCPNCGADMTAEQTEPSCSEKPNNCELQYEMGMETLKCDNCSEYGSFKCAKCDGEMYFKRLAPKDEPQTDCAWK